MTKALTKQDTSPVLPLPDRFVDFVGKSNVPAPTFVNARIALAKLGVDCWHDLFTNKKYVGGHALNSEVGGQVSDEIVLALRVMIRKRFDFDPGKNNTWDAVNLLCRERGIHPVREYLIRCHQDWLTFYCATERIDRMLIDYFGAPDTPFVRGVSRIVMVASCRRIFEPGCKFDYMTVLESPEGYNKSQSLATLYGPQWFSDQTILGLEDKQLAETVRGRWCIECADLSGMRKAEVEKIKAQLSRFEDRTRPAYGRAVIDAPRSCVFWGTTNDQEYLRSQTGNRRFFPIPVGRIDVEGLRRARDLLWGEAMHAHLAGEDIMLPEHLWEAAAIEQRKRTIGDPWEELTDNVSEVAAEYMKVAADKVLGAAYSHDSTHERITSAFILTRVLGIPSAQQNAEYSKRLGLVMRKHGWQGPKPLWIGGRAVKGYERDLAAAICEAESEA